MKRLIFIVIGIFLAIGGAILLGFILPIDIHLSDFLVLFQTDRLLLHNIFIYDHLGQVNRIAAETGLPPSQVELLPYPYPPWYALSTIYLGMLPYEVSARVWLILNIFMVALSVWLLTDGWLGWYRLAAIACGVIFVPVLGILVVGQYPVPVLLGIAIYVYAVRHGDVPLVAFGLWLMTFKPHIGLLLLLAGFLWLVFQKTPFSRRAIWLTLALGLVMGLVGFIADPLWPVDYLHSLLLYRALPGVSSCGLCSSLSVVIVRFAVGQSNTLSAAWVSIALAVGLGILLFWKGRLLIQTPETLMGVSALATLLIDPYLLNYDFVLLLIPILFMAQSARSPWTWLLLILAYLLPWVALALGREGNLLLPGSALLLTGFYLVKQDSITSTQSGPNVNLTY